MLERFVPIGANEWKAFERVLIRRPVRRGAALLSVGAQCDRVAVIEHGLTRTFYVSDGAELTVELSREGALVGNYASLLTGTPSSYAIEALEDSTLIELHGHDMQRFYESLPMGDRLGRLVAEHLFVRSVARSTRLLTQTPEARYLALRTESPDLLQRVRQYHVASYLGISPETLSRIRRRVAAQRMDTATSAEPPSNTKAPRSKLGGPKVPRAPRENP